ncbi:hypothetical protein EGR_09365 [Echinococcus granulosus]|uniref:Uncharacterized protein n=1 Tax=Echinococcus granulosus TaxID=6210 RepID=W6UQU6_ECHGR|nr:hypothetical protein EGR_09365 [Echinococcus granulosus]EUB55799.1 hypothetical protein EGR_09365 [Echinococcus granulosus]
MSFAGNPSSPVFSTPAEETTTALILCFVSLSPPKGTQVVATFPLAHPTPSVVMPPTIAIHCRISAFAPPQKSSPIESSDAVSERYEARFQFLHLPAARDYIPSTHNNSLVQLALGFVINSRRIRRLPSPFE